jgi:hypothetical protein
LTPFPRGDGRPHLLQSPPPPPRSSLPPTRHILCGDGKSCLLQLTSPAFSLILTHVSPRRRQTLAGAEGLFGPGGPGVKYAKVEFVPRALIKGGGGGGGGEDPAAPARLLAQLRRGGGMVVHTIRWRSAQLDRHTHTHTHTRTHTHTHTHTHTPTSASPAASIVAANPHTHTAMVVHDPPLGGSPRGSRASAQWSARRMHCATSYERVSCHAMPCHAMPCHAIPCHAMPCQSISHHIEPGLGDAEFFYGNGPVSKEQYAHMMRFDMTHTCTHARTHTHTHTHIPSSVVFFTQGRKSGGFGFETCSGVIPQAALLSVAISPWLINKLAIYIYIYI